MGQQIKEEEKVLAVSLTDESQLLPAPNRLDHIEKVGDGPEPDAPDNAPNGQNKMCSQKKRLDPEYKEEEGLLLSATLELDLSFVLNDTWSQVGISFFLS